VYRKAKKYVTLCQFASLKSEKRKIPKINYFNYDEQDFSA